MPHTTGRPRDTAIDDAVLTAADELLDEAGVGALTIGAVARRAGVGRPAIYRRWPDRPHLALAVIAHRMAAVDVPATDCTVCDLHELLALTSAVYRSLGAGTVAQLLAESTHDPELRAEVTQAVLDPVRDVVRRTLSAAADRGDLRPTTDLDLGADTLCALVFHRLLLDHAPLDDHQVEVVVTGLLRGLAARPEELLAAAGAHPHD